MRPIVLLFQKLCLNYFSSNGAFLLLNVDDFFGIINFTNVQCLHTMDNHMEICRICCQILRKLKFWHLNNWIHYSLLNIEFIKFHLFNSLNFSSLEGRWTRSQMLKRLTAWEWSAYAHKTSIRYYICAGTHSYHTLSIQYLHGCWEYVKVTAV